MATELGKHQVEIERNQTAWQRKALLREIYAGFYRRIKLLIDERMSGAIVEIGSGIGNLKTHVPEAITTDLFANLWLDVVCDGYEMPWATGSVSHLILFDVFHHLQAPRAFLMEAQRVLAPKGRVILFEPYISALSYPVYGLLHHEAVAWGEPISQATKLGRPRGYYAAQGNATRMFFGRLKVESQEWKCVDGWKVFHAEAIASFSYLLSGGFSKPALYPAKWLTVVGRIDRALSRWPRVFGARCLVGLEKVNGQG